MAQIKWIGVALLFMLASADTIAFAGKISHDTAHLRRALHTSATLDDADNLLKDVLSESGARSKKKLRAGREDDDGGASAISKKLAAMTSRLRAQGAKLKTEEERLAHARKLESFEAFTDFFSKLGEKVKNMWNSLKDKTKEFLAPYSDDIAKINDYKRKLGINETKIALNALQVGEGILCGLGSLLVPALGSEEVDSGADAILAFKRCFYPPKIKEQYFSDDTMWQFKWESSQTTEDQVDGADEELAKSLTAAGADNDESLSDMMLTFASSLAGKAKNAFANIAGIMKKLGQIVISILKHSVACGYGSILIGLVVAALITAFPFILVVLIPFAALFFAIEIFTQLRNLVKYWGENWFLFGKALGLFIGYIVEAILIYKAFKAKGKTRPQEEIFDGGSCALNPSGRRLLDTENRTGRLLLSRAIGLCPMRQRPGGIKKVMGKDELQGFSRTTKFKGPGGNPAGNVMYQRDDLINPFLRDAQKRTNVDRMVKGLAPIGPDGKPLNLHHVYQTMDGPLAELSQTFHKINHGALHQPNTVPSTIDRNTFARFRYQYWRQRGLEMKALHGLSHHRFHLMAAPTNLNEGESCDYEGQQCHNCCSQGMLCLKRTWYYTGEGCWLKSCCTRAETDPKACQRIVQETYQDVLCRNPSEDELQPGMEQCQAGKLTAEDFALQLASTPEFIACTKCKNQCQIPEEKAKDVYDLVKEEQKNVGTFVKGVLDTYTDDIKDDHPFFGSLLTMMGEDLAADTQKIVNGQGALPLYQGVDKGYPEDELDAVSEQLWEEEFGGPTGTEIFGIIVLVLFLLAAAVATFFLYRRWKWQKLKASAGGTTQPDPCGGCISCMGRAKIRLTRCCVRGDNQRLPQEDAI